MVSAADAPLVGVVLIVAVAALGLFWVWTSGARAGVRAGRAVSSGWHAVASAGAVLPAAVLITSGQWALLRATTDPVAWALGLGMPALLAGVALARLLVVTGHSEPAGERQPRRSGVGPRRRRGGGAR